MARPTREAGPQPPVVLVKWFDHLKWLLERIDSFPKNQRFIFGQRMADYGIGILELLVEAAYSPAKAELLARANRRIEVLRWLVRLAKERELLTVRQYGFACKGLPECGRMVGGWLKQAAAKEVAADVSGALRVPFGGGTRSVPDTSNSKAILKERSSDAHARPPF